MPFAHERARKRFGLAAILMVVACIPLAAWEQDVHYALTLWLATQVGFTPLDARDIAMAAEAPDDNYRRPATEAVLLAIATGEDASLKEVQKYHFPSNVKAYFGPSGKRIVQEGSGDARYLVNLILAAPASPATYSRDLQAFGDALHPFQDSWSHAGESDLPPRPARPPIKPDKMWSHPQSRGGWDRHDADLTWLDVKGATATAFETWKALDQFAKSRLGAAYKAGTFRALDKSVNDFVKADSQKAKADWMRGHGFADSEARRIAGTLDAPGSVLPPDLRLAIRVVANAQWAANAVPAAAADLLRRVLDDWLTKRALDAVLSNVDLDSIARELTDASGGASIDPALWCRKFLAMWFVADHGVVNQMGHGDPRAAGYSDLPTAPLNNGALAARPPGDGVQVPPGGIFRVDPEVVGVPNAFGAAVTFPQMPQDLVIVVVAPSSASQWRIIRLWRMVS